MLILDILWFIVKFVWFLFRFIWYTIKVICLSLVVPFIKQTWNDVLVSYASDVLDDVTDLLSYPFKEAFDIFRITSTNIFLYFVPARLKDNKKVKKMPPIVKKSKKAKAKARAKALAISQSQTQAQYHTKARTKRK